MDNTLKTARCEAETKDEQRILSNNAWHLARYLIEHDHELTIPDTFDPGQFLLWAEKYPELSDDDKVEFVKKYAELEKATGSVTARTLYATRIYGRGFFSAAFCTSVGQYLVFLSIITIAFLAPLIAQIISSNNGNSLIPISETFLPFCAAGLGTCVYLLRVTQEKLRSREFDPAHIPSQLIRLGLGMLAGGTVVLFPDFLATMSSTREGVDAGAAVASDISLGKGSIAFILGYAVDIFYGVLDNIGGTINSRNK